VNAKLDGEFREFMHARWPVMVRLAYGLTGDQGHAEDVAQAAFARAYGSWPRVRRSGNPDAYVRQIVINENRNRFRKRRVPERLTDSLPESGLVDVEWTDSAQPPGPDSQTGLIASGTINGQWWWIVADRPGVDGASAGQQDILVIGPGVGEPFEANLFVPALGTAGGPGPVSFIASPLGAPAQIQVGAVQADVSYVTVRLGNGTVLMLHPVTVYGTRAVAFAVPVRAEITDVTAYSRHGEIAFAVPFNWPGGTAWVISWLRPGQHQPARVSGLIGSGTVQGKAWSATAYLGPWGTCIALADSARPGAGCFPSAPTVAGVVTLNQDSLDPGSTPEIAGGVAPASAARVVVTQPDGTAVRVRLVTVGDEKLFAFALRPGAKPLRWIAYDGSGKVVASS
jgi:hypothetical protein